MEECQVTSGAVYGVRVHGRVPASFASYLGPVGGEGPGPGHRLEVRYRLRDPLPAVPETWVSEAQAPRGAARLALFRLRDGVGIAVSGMGRGHFRCTARRIGIEWATPETGAAHCFFSYALPLWLETRGVPVLHGSAVSLEGQGIGFVGRTGTGKSTLCAELLRLGFDFLSDDGLALRRDAAGAWSCSPGPPMLRLWPSGLRRRLGIDPETLPRVHGPLEKRRLPLEREAAGSAAGPPLQALYRLERRPEAVGPVEIEACRPADALALLVEHGVAVGPMAALGLSGRRLPLLADVAETVPVRLLRYPSGVDSAARIRDAVVREGRRGGPAGSPRGRGGR